MYEKLNIKKVIIAILIGVLLIVSIIVFTISRIGAHKNIVEQNNYNNDISIVEKGSKSTKEVFTDTEKTISIELDKKYNLVQSQNNEYLIKVSSNENVDIYISRLEGLEDRELYSVARADRLAYLESYNSY